VAVRFGGMALATKGERAKEKVFCGRRPECALRNRKIKQ